ncbi:MAG: matrixin family metalloprotease [Phycisphaerales bacterium]|nr:matrixin family metalloprotease [Phycisphaerales bacterium]
MLVPTAYTIALLLSTMEEAPRGGGMIGDGWDGPGQHPATVYFHIENAKPTLGVRQREQLLDVLEDWSEVAQIDFVELAVPNQPRCIDLLWAEGDHCALEPSECGIPACTFAGQYEEGVVHAAYPPGVETICGGMSTESRAGNIHFNLANDTIKTDPSHAGYQYKLIVAKMIGHALGLQSNPSDFRWNVMGPIEWNEPYVAISKTDALQLQQGYAAGAGSLTTLESSGVWVNSNWSGDELGTPGLPVNTLAEGFDGVPPFSDGVTIHLQGGLYPESITIDRACVVTSEFGTAYIGQ